MTCSLPRGTRWDHPFSSLSLLNGFLDIEISFMYRGGPPLRLLKPPFAPETHTKLTKPCQAKIVSVFLTLPLAATQIKSIYEEVKNNKNI